LGEGDDKPDRFDQSDFRYDAESDYGVFIAPRIDIATEDNEPDPVLLFQKACFPRAA